MKLRLILGDQLNENHPWFDSVDNDVIYLQMEIRQETDYAPHHIQKLIAFFASMRHFNKVLKNLGHKTHYIKLDDPSNLHDLVLNIELLIKKYNVKSFDYQMPDEFRLSKQLKEFKSSLNILSKVYDTYHFMASKDELKEYFTGKKQYILEFFYRKMRKKFNLLMIGEQPEGGQWNFDKNNRKKWKGSPEIPPVFYPSTNELSALNQLFVEQGLKIIGKFDSKSFIYPLSR